MNIIVVVPPPVEPIVLDDVYGHLRIDAFGSPAEHPDDAELTRHIATARTQAEQITRRAFVQQTLLTAVHAFPCPRNAFSYSRPDRRFDYEDSYQWRAGYIELRRPPFISIDLVQYYDANNALQTLASSNYYVDEISDIVPRLQFKDTAILPQTYCRDDAVRITWTAGYQPEGSPAENYSTNVPTPIKSAILLGVELLYDNFKPDDRAAMERARDSLLASYVVNSF